MKRFTFWVLTLAIAVLSAASAHAGDSKLRYPMTGTLSQGWHADHKALDISSGKRNNPYSTWKDTDGNGYYEAYGNNVYASHDGRVDYVRTTSPGTSYGKYIRLKHCYSGGNWKYRTLYAHLWSIDVSAGQNVSQGQKIGVEGNTGNVRSSAKPYGGVHVHWVFEKRINGSYVAQKLPGKPGNKVQNQQSTGIIMCGSGSATPPPPPPSEWPKLRRITTSTLNVRTGPGTSYQDIGDVHKDERYVAVAQSGSWYKIYFKGNTAWIHGGYTADSSGTCVKVATATLNVRTGPGTNYSDVGDTHQNELYFQAATSGSWRRIHWGGSTDRWVHGSYVTTVTVSSSSSSTYESSTGGNGDATDLLENPQGFADDPQEALEVMQEIDEAEYAMAEANSQIDSNVETLMNTDVSDAIMMAEEITGQPLP